MSAPTKKNRKRKSGAPRTPAGFSSSLKDARLLLDSGQHESGLAALNRLAASTRNPNHRAKILMLLAGSEASLSRHSEAAAAFSKASQFARQSANLDLLLRSTMGEIRSLLRALKTDEARTVAIQFVTEFEAIQKKFQDLLNLTPAQLLAASGKIDVPAQPPRPTVYLTKIANAFIESGLTDDARHYLGKAVELSPNGASRARQVLAKLALASDEPALAERYARESLLMGRFQAKTVASWQLYLDARARQNLAPILETDVFAAFGTHAKDRIATASVLLIVRALRAHGDAGWRDIALAAISAPGSDAVVAVELEKLVHADAKLTGSEPPRALAARSLRLFRRKSVSPQEQVAHAKEFSRYSLLAGEAPNPEILARAASAVHGGIHASDVRHAMALGAMMAGSHDLARTWILNILNHLEPGTKAYGKATWALARMEAMLGNDAEAAVWFLELAQAGNTPPRFRIQAVLRGLRHLAKSGNAVDIPKVSASVRTILAEADDYRTVLDSARQLALAGSNFSELKDHAASLGEALADAAIRTSSTSGEYLAILEYLARKQYWDLNNAKGIVSRWDGLDNSRKMEFAASSTTVWYDYLAVVFKALVAEGRQSDASILAAGIINGDNSSQEGYVIVGTEYAMWLLDSGKKHEAFAYFEWIVKEAPDYRGAALAHYWLAVRSLKNQDPDGARRSASFVRKCYSGAPALVTEYEIDARAILILGIQHDLSRYPSGYNKIFATGQMQYLEEDIRSL